eukprot:TRINITY_DN5875_c0_g1_i1.p1 TRINITY_DN5875_c0_g1~~TRINITY_DN5875_c0_g1_i1.p1  ORF type:complete len:492 (+),score=126.05 TRINITY_DN5875_c0_g1_i1:104-1477(+)
MDDEEEKEEVYDWRKKVAEEAAKNQRKNTLETAQALGEDPLAFEYDAVYDEMKGVAPKPTKPVRGAQGNKTMSKKPTPLVGQKGVKYGLQSVFNMDDEEEKEEVYDWRKKVAEEAAKNQRKNTLETAQALGEDPLAFEYDAVYDEMKGVAPKPTKPVRGAQAKQPPKYISNLLDAAKKREIEREMVMQKQIQKQAEIEKELLGDIEQFVTPTYKKKLEEQRKFEEEQRKKEAAELSRTVEGKKDMNAFYRNFVNTVALGGARPDEENNKTETKDDTKDKKQSTAGSDLDRKPTSDNRDKPRDDRDKRDSRRDYRDDDRDKKSRRSRSRSRSRDRKSRRDRSRSRSRDRSSRGDSNKGRDDRHRRSRSRSASRSDNDRKRKREEDAKESSKDRTSKQDNNKDNKSDINKDSNAPVSAEDKAKFARRNDDVAVSSARERYLQRKAQMEAEAAKNAAANK